MNTEMNHVEPTATARDHLLVLDRLVGVELRVSKVYPHAIFTVPATEHVEVRLSSCAFQEWLAANTDSDDLWEVTCWQLDTRGRYIDTWPLAEYDFWAKAERKYLSARATCQGLRLTLDQLCQAHSEV